MSTALLISSFASVQAALNTACSRFGNIFCKAWSRFSAQKKFREYDAQQNAFNV
jgi:hypothetical protein